MTEKTAPAATDPKPGHTPGYAEPQPRDKQDARNPAPGHKRNPDEGGLTREPEKTPGK